MIKWSLCFSTQWWKREETPWYWERHPKQMAMRVAWNQSINASEFPKLNSTHGPLSMALKDHIRKFDIPETAICILCSVDIEYMQGGLGTINMFSNWKTWKTLVLCLKNKSFLERVHLKQQISFMHHHYTVRLQLHPIHLMCHKHPLCTFLAELLIWRRWLLRFLLSLVCRLHCQISWSNCLLNLARRVLL